MNPETRDQLRRELHGAASSAPTALGVDNGEVLAHGHHGVLRRRTIGVAAAVVGSLAVVVTIGALAPRVGDTDTLPALPTPTAASPTSDAIPTVSASSSPTTSVTPSTAASSETPTDAASTSSPESAPSVSPTQEARDEGGGWSEAVIIGGRTYRARLVPASGSPNYDLELRAGGTAVFSPEAVFNTEGRWGIDEGSPRIAYYLGGTKLIDLVSIEGMPVDDEAIAHIDVPTPDGRDIAGEPYVDLFVTVFRTSSPNTMADGGPQGWVVRFAGGGLWDLTQQ